jgi:hypothetical protein
MVAISNSLAQGRKIKKCREENSREVREGEMFGGEKMLLYLDPTKTMVNDQEGSIVTPEVKSNRDTTRLRLCSLCVNLHFTRWMDVARSHPRPRWTNVNVAWALAQSRFSVRARARERVSERSYHMRVRLQDAWNRQESSLAAFY